MHRLYQLSRFISAIVILLLLTSESFARSEAAVPKKSTTGAVFRSLFVPGWGQFYNEQYVKAAVLFIVEGSLIASISHEHDLMMASKHNNLDDFQNEKLHRNNRNKLIWWLSATVLLSLGDAYVDAQLFGLNISPELTMGESNSFGLSASLSF